MPDAWQVDDVVDFLEFALTRTEAVIGVVALLVQKTDDVLRFALSPLFGRLLGSNPAKPTVV